MKKLIFIFIILPVLSSCSKSQSENLEIISQENSAIELKKKELELKERELDLKEKEINKESLKKKKCTQDEVETFLQKWASYQSNKNLNSYIKCYSNSFEGIKRTNSGKRSYYDYNGWISDRSKMINNNSNILVSTYNIKVIGFDENSGITRVTFSQYFSSDNYADEGTKEMMLTKDDNGNIIIKKEEMIDSYKVLEEGF